MDSLDNYKTGHPYYGDIPSEKIDKYAELFGEGSKYLTELLKLCWENGIKTSACCKGHSDCNPVKVGYVVFSGDKELAQYLCDSTILLPFNITQVDKYNGNLRIEIMVFSDFRFREIAKLIQEYIKIKAKGISYKPRLSGVSEQIDHILLSNDNDKLVTFDNVSLLYNMDDEYRFINKHEYDINHMMGSIIPAYIPETRKTEYLIFRDIYKDIEIKSLEKKVR